MTQVSIRSGFRREDFPRYFAELGFRRGVEIGVARGAHAEALCRAIPDLELICVDPWKKYKANPRSQPPAVQEESYRQTVERLRPYPGVTIKRMMSQSAAKDVPLGSLDFALIDGNHGRWHVSRDLTLWSDRVRSGGIVVADDYYHFRYAGVVEAVDAFLKARGIRKAWITDETRRNHRGVKQPSIFWVNP